MHLLPETEQLFFIMRISHALLWARALLAGLATPASRTLAISRWTDVTSRSALLQTSIRTDASPFGFGAVLFVQGRRIARCAGDWTSTDLRLRRAVRGDPAWQAEWEILAALVAVDVWLPRLRGQTLCLIQMDATAALFSIMKSTGKTPVMNAMCAEIALRLECARVQTVPEHLTGTLNFDCDALSRLSTGSEIPVALRGVLRAHPRLRSASFFWAWPRSLRSLAQGPPTHPSNVCGPDDSVKVAEASQPWVRPGGQQRSKEKEKAKTTDRKHSDQAAGDAVFQ